MGREGRGVNQQSTQKGSAERLKFVGGEGGEGEGRVSINSQPGKDPQRFWKDYLWPCWSWGGGLIDSLGRICKDFGMITSDNADPGGGSIDSSLRKDLWSLIEDLQRLRICQNCWPCGWWWSIVHPGRIHKGLGSIDSQLGKDLQRIWKDYLWQCWSRGWSIDSPLRKDLQGLERIWKNWWVLGGWQLIVHSGRICKRLRVDQQSTWEGSTKTLEGLPLMYVQCWSLRGGTNQQSTWEGSAKTSAYFGVYCCNVDPGGWSINSQLQSLQKSLQILPRINIVRSTVNSKVCGSRCRSFPSWLSIDPPGSTLSEVILPSFWSLCGFLPKLIVNWPPSPPSPPTNFNLSADPFWVDCQSTPLPSSSLLLPSPPFPSLPLPSHLQISTSLQILSELTVDQPLPSPLHPSLPTYQFKPLCRSFLSWLSIDPPFVLIRGQSTDFEQNSSHSSSLTINKQLDPGKVLLDSYLHISF